MKDREKDEKMKVIEEEIDSAIDQLFVDKTIPSQETETRESMPEDSREISASEAVPSIEKPETQEGETSIAFKKEADHENEKIEKYVQIIAGLKKRVEKFIEWGVTDSALENIREGILKIGDQFAENKMVVSAVRMVTEVLDFLEKNQEMHLREMVEFVTDAFGSLEKLIQADKGEGNASEEVFDTLNSQFSKISTLMTFEIPKIELDEDISGIASGEDHKKDETQDDVPEEIEHKHVEVADEEAEKVKEVVEEKFETTPTISENDDILEMTFLGADSEEEIFLEKEQEKKPETKTETQKLEKKEGVPEDSRKDLPGMGNFENLIREITGSLKEMERMFFLARDIPEIAGKLSTEIVTLSEVVTRITAEISSGIFSEKDLKELQETAKKIQTDFNLLSRSISIDPNVDDKIKIEEVMPVIVGKKTVGFLAQEVQKVYAITPKQEQLFKEKRFISLKGEKIPFVDLLSEYGEFSANPDKRVVIIENRDGIKGVLVDKVLKKRFAFVYKEGPELLKIVKFYFSEEIPLYGMPW